MKRTLLPAACVAAGLLATGLLATAALASPKTDAHHPWISSPVAPQPPSTYFVNLRDGDRIETPFVLKFGLSRFGLAPIVKGVAETGHHHLLVDRELPLDFTKPLPFNDQYIHFGKGQMETVLTFPPGTYRLRLLLADHKHIPHFIYSKPVTVTVTKKNGDAPPAAATRPAVALLEPSSGATVRGPFRLQFHASGAGVAHQSIAEGNVGHFQLVAERPGQAAETLKFPNGATEAWLAPPPGDYVMRLQLVRNAAPNDVIAASSPVAVKVAP